MRNERGFTLIELIIVIVVLGIMAALAIPKFLGIRADARVSAVKGALGGVRSAIANYKAKQIAANQTTVTVTAAVLADGTTVMDGAMPENPYSAATTTALKSQVNTCTVAKGTVDTGAGINDAWCYKQSGTGITAIAEFWANSAVAGENLL